MLRIVATRGRRVYRQDARAQIRGGRIGKPAIRACAARKEGSSRLRPGISMVKGFGGELPSSMNGPL
jgi:hypothetical protein